MIKRIIIYMFAIIICFPVLLPAENYVGIGAHLGFHHNVGNLDSQYADIEIDPQNNYFLGFSFKTNFLFLFARFGADTTFLINRSETLESSGEIASAKIHYISLPLFVGLNYKVLDLGNFYMGPGLSYFVARGHISSASPGLSDDVSATGWGFGFTAGIEYNLALKLDFYFEWEYLNGKSEPVLQGSSAYNWKDLYVDFTGHRLMLGVRYYLL
ncbi:MAG: outer membrane beta-barrel protein [Spirochaetes bacterium]|nr:outer membrane beta-barrel protein [Spirochaetota bacterium]